MQDLGHAQAGETTWRATADVRISAGHRPAGGRTGQPGTMVGIRASRCDRRLKVGKPCNPGPDLPSPLRYPGGKQILSRVVAHLVALNGATGGTYVEPYAGGAGVALALLFSERVEQILINDADARIFAFWKSVLDSTDRFVTLLRETPTNVEEWARQRRIYQQPGRHSCLRVGFAAFYLNRCNRSGIISSGGPIGGQDQKGRWKIDARYNRDELERRIRKIALYRDSIRVSNEDAIDFLDAEVAGLSAKARPFVYLDPPYYGKGRDLYLSFYEHDDHAALAEHMVKKAHFPWIMSYDNVPQIANLYRGLRQVRFSLDYSARERREGSEVMIFRPDLVFPKRWIRTIPRCFISSADDAPALPPA
jgi:DNA adenine methylase